MHKYTSKKRLCTVGELNSGVRRLDAYIKNCEKLYEQEAASKKVSRRRMALLEYIDRLMESIEREELKKKEAFEYLKASNEAMKRTITKLQDSIKCYRESMPAEFQKLDTLNTERLLSLDPKLF
ncbi:uncharacterized protein LOC124431617 [Vespa crabro]|uniref:uncharacterized protein LOC124431617 n=1 Tax=Vespa crabro TaxID=7445 RepID=UPI001F005D36|nr:uncharacterized protein LOC124431617 [Vespa crabro]